MLTEKKINYKQTANTMNAVQIVYVGEFKTLKSFCMLAFILRQSKRDANVIGLPFYLRDFLFLF